jgi:hypothetical protein
LCQTIFFARVSFCGAGYGNFLPLCEMLAQQVLPGGTGAAQGNSERILSYTTSYCCWRAEFGPGPQRADGILADAG